MLLLDFPSLAACGLDPAFVENGVSSAESQAYAPVSRIWLCLQHKRDFL